MLESKIKDQSALLQIHSLKLPESPHCAHLRTHPETYTVRRLPYPHHTISGYHQLISLSLSPTDFPSYRTRILSATDSISRVRAFVSRPSRTRERTRCRPPSPIPPTSWPRPVNPTTWSRSIRRLRSRLRSRTWSQTWPCSRRSSRWQSQQSEALPPPPSPNLSNGSPFPFVSQLYHPPLTNLYVFWSYPVGLTTVNRLPALYRSYSTLLPYAEGAVSV